MFHSYALCSSSAELHLSHQHSFLPWKHFSAAHLTQLALLQSLSERRALVASILALEEKFPLGECSTHDGGATPQQRREQEQAEQVEQDPNITRREITIDLALSVLGSVGRRCDMHGPSRHALHR